MKKIIFLILSAVLLYPHSTPAQFITGFGIKGGVTLSDQNYSYSINVAEAEHKFKIGFNGGIFAEFLNTRNFNLIAETGYDQRGYVYVAKPTNEFGEPLEEVDIGYRTNYIYAALGAKLKYKSKSVTPYFHLLPRIDFYLGHNIILPEN